MSEPIPANAFPRISFGIIVLNGEPFTRYCIEALYPHAHQIIVAEGAIEGSKAFTREDRHSTDGTYETLRDLKENHDPEDKLIIVHHPDGYWEDRDDQSRAYAREATGDYLWQVDIDEFYLPGDIAKVRRILRDDPSITGGSFRWLMCWGSEAYRVDGTFFRRGDGDVNRLMKWGEGYEYGNHYVGPRSTAPDGTPMTEVNWKPAPWWLAHGIWMFHPSLVFPSQVLQKTNPSSLEAMSLLHAQDQSPDRP